jgi:hypothetical protein
MFNMSNTDKKYKLIKISKQNYDVLNNLGKTNDTFNTVLTKIFEKNHLLPIITEED